MCLISTVLVTLDLDYGTELVSKDFRAGLGFFLSFSVSCLGGTLHSDYLYRFWFSSQILRF